MKQCTLTSQTIPETRLLDMFDEAFSKLGFSIRKEIRFSFVRLDREAMCGPMKYFVEAESNQKFARLGIRQLVTMKEQVNYDTNREYTEYTKFFLLLPDIGGTLRRSVSRFHIETIDSSDL